MSCLEVTAPVRVASTFLGLDACAEVPSLPSLGRRPAATVELRAPRVLARAARPDEAGRAPRAPRADPGFARDTPPTARRLPHESSTSAARLAHRSPGRPPSLVSDEVCPLDPSPRPPSVPRPRSGAPHRERPPGARGAARKRGEKPGSRSRRSTWWEASREDCAHPASARKRARAWRHCGRGRVCAPARSTARAR